MKVVKYSFFVGALILGIFVAVESSLAQEPPPQPPPTSTYIPGEIVVKFEPHVRAQGAQGSLRADGVHPLEAAQESGLMRVQVEPGREAEAIAELMARGDVEFATFNHSVHTMGDPDDTEYWRQWALPQIDAPEAWDLHTGGNSITIAILDTGVDLDHPDLQTNIVAGYDFANGDSNPNDDHYGSHGTHVAGISAAVGNNAKGVAGVSWGAKIMPIKVLDSSGNGSTFNVAQGIYYAVDHGANIINMSLGAAWTSWPCNWFDIEAALDYAVNQGVLVVVAAGNDGKYGVSCPGAYDQVIAVGSTTSSDTRSYFSNYGPRLDIAAPGSSIYSTYIDGNPSGPGTYGYKNGTSMAAPYVSGLAALIWSYGPSQTHNQVRDIIQNSADDLDTPGWDQYFGYGRINAWQAVNAISLQSTSTTLLLDDDSGPVYGNIQLTTVNPDIITWTATISPTVPWLNIASTSTGTVSASSSPVSVDLVATTAALTYGTHIASVAITGTTYSGSDVGLTTSEVRVIYRSELYEYRFPFIFKNATPQ